MRAQAMPTLLLLAAAGVVVAASASCNASSQDCGPETCPAGCCDATGACQTAQLASACGLGGVACDACGAGEACGAGGCYSLSTGVDAGSELPDAGLSCKSEGAACLSPIECCADVCIDGQCGTPPSCDDIKGDRATQVCLRWNCDRANLTNGTWTGSLERCVAGENPVGRENTLRIVNLYRFLANLPEVTTSPERDQKAQECALMMDVNNHITHYPPETWECYTEGGAEAARSSNLSPVQGAFSVDLYMADGAVPDSLGHRRWLLAPELGPIGAGSAGQPSCLWVTKGTGTATRAYVPWPPRGPFPLQAFQAGIGADINKIGWSIQSYTIDLSTAQVTVSDGVNELPINLYVLEGQAGSTWAVRFVPDGWEPEAGNTYTVSVTNVSSPFSYGVQVIDCE